MRKSSHHTYNINQISGKRMCVTLSCIPLSEGDKPAVVRGETSRTIKFGKVLFFSIYFSETPSNSYRLVTYETRAARIAIFMVIVFVVAENECDVG